MSWLGALLTEVGWEIGRQAAKWSRKRSKREVLEEQARWSKSHLGVGPHNTQCAVCLQHPVSHFSRCPGPPATQAARAKLKSEYGVDVW